MPIPLDVFTDSELLAFCEVADEILRRAAGQHRRPSRKATRFLEILEAKQIWLRPEVE